MNEIWSRLRLLQVIFLPLREMIFHQDCVIQFSLFLFNDYNNYHRMVLDHDPSFFFIQRFDLLLPFQNNKKIDFLLS